MRTEVSSQMSKCGITIRTTHYLDFQNSPPNADLVFHVANGDSEVLGQVKKRGKDICPETHDRGSGLRTKSCPIPYR